LRLRLDIFENITLHFGIMDRDTKKTLRK